MQKTRVWLTNALISVIVFILLVALLEGLSSLTISAFDWLSEADRPVVNQYDAHLGWTGKPNLHIPDMYGPGRFVRTNSNGYRSAEEVPAIPRNGQTRIICTGDSFTFGEGVGNEDTWCRKLAVLNKGIETVNIGQPGYGVDQMFLAYRRIALDVQHAVVIFAFVDGDFGRMAFDNRYGYGKPVLILENGLLAVKNVPVPEFRWSLYRSLDKAELRVQEFLERLANRLSKPIDEQSRIGDVENVAVQIFREIQLTTATEGILPVFVYLPTKNDMRRLTPWREWVMATFAGLDMPFFDFTEEMRNLPMATATRFFFPDDSLGTGHYTEAGNAWIADQLLMKLTNVENIAVLLRDR